MIPAVSSAAKRPDPGLSSPPAPPHPGAESPGLPSPPAGRASAAGAARALALARALEEEAAAAEGAPAAQLLLALGARCPGPPAHSPKPWPGNEGGGGGSAPQGLGGRGTRDRREAAAAAAAAGGPCGQRTREGRAGPLPLPPGRLLGAGAAAGRADGRTERLELPHSPPSPPHSDTRLSTAILPSAATAAWQTRSGVQALERTLLRQRRHRRRRGKPGTEPFLLRSPPRLPLLSSSPPFPSSAAPRGAGGVNFTRRGQTGPGPWLPGCGAPAAPAPPGPAPRRLLASPEHFSSSKPLTNPKESPRSGVCPEGTAQPQFPHLQNGQGRGEAPREEGLRRFRARGFGRAERAGTEGGRPEGARSGREEEGEARRGGAERSGAGVKGLENRRARRGLGPAQRALPPPGGRGGLGWAGLGRRAGGGAGSEVTVERTLELGEGRRGRGARSGRGGKPARARSRATPGGDSARATERAGGLGRLWEGKGEEPGQPAPPPPDGGGARGSSPPASSAENCWGGAVSRGKESAPGFPAPFKLSTLFERTRTLPPPPPGLVPLPPRFTSFERKIKRGESLQPRSPWPVHFPRTDHRVPARECVSLLSRCGLEGLLNARHAACLHARSEREQQAPAAAPCRRARRAPPWEPRAPLRRHRRARVRVRLRGDAARLTPRERRAGRRAGPGRSAPWLCNVWEQPPKLPISCKKPQKLRQRSPAGPTCSPAGGGVSRSKAAAQPLPAPLGPVTFPSLKQQEVVFWDSGRAATLSPLGKALRKPPRAAAPARTRAFPGPRAGALRDSRGPCGPESSENFSGRVGPCSPMGAGRSPSERARKAGRKRAALQHQATFSRFRDVLKLRLEPRVRAVQGSESSGCRITNFSERGMFDQIAARPHKQALTALP
ncbi:collagen alpha-1(I) chain-like [Vombatus ursinus]|uniref:collagen alpha-1(I) chain-like n=1 Tax=Vombatus ursinus TaxID=29139 RepID=UPI000FFDA75F|nr:collagen alpha-1(I) chain-like [Vombatus ursinus]